MSKIYNAFHGDAAVKQAVIERLQRHWSAGHVRPWFSMAFSEPPGHCSVMGATIEGTDADAYERELGIPAGAGYLHEALLMHCGHQPWSADFRDSPPFEIADFARDYPVQWLQAVPLGANLGLLVPRFVAWLMHELIDAQGSWWGQLDAGLRAAGTQVSVLFDAALKGSVVTTAQWKEARHAAVQATDAARQSFCRRVGEFIESVAWPPASSAQELHVHVTGLWHALDDALQRPKMNPAGMAQQDALDRLHEEMKAASQSPGFDKQAFFERPEFVAAMSAEGERRRTALHEASLPVIYPVVQRHFEAWLQLTREAG